MNTLVLLVEDEVAIKNVLAKYLERAAISFIFAANLTDAVQLFEANKRLITYIALDGNLEKGARKELPDTLVLAEIIADSKDFTGTVFPMSSNSEHNKILQGALGERCEKHMPPEVTLKIDVIREIIKRVAQKRIRKS